MVCNNVLEYIGHTPMIRLNRMNDPEAAEVLVKFEGLNVGGSIKTRTALNMILDAEEKGIIKDDTIIVEPTSGNQGIGLSLVGAVRGYKTIIIMPDSVSEERRKLVQQYGAEIRIVHDDGDIGKCIQTCIQMAQDMKKDDPRVFVPQQFENMANYRAHLEQTGAEIVRQVEGPIHGFCSGIGTGGTISGVGRAIKNAYPDAVVWAIEPEHAAILSGEKVGSHIQMGIGDGLIPEILDQKVYDEIITIEDDAAIEYGKLIGTEEGFLVGISSGGALAAAIEVAKRKEAEGKTIVVLLPDSGDRYYSTKLFQ